MDRNASKDHDVACQRDSYDIPFDVFVKLAELARKGQTEALSRLARMLYPAIHRRIRRKLGTNNCLQRWWDSTDFAEDITADLVNDLANGKVTLEGRNRFLSLLDRLIEHRLTDAFREMKAQSPGGGRMVPLEQVPPIASRVPTPSEIAMRKEWWEALQRLLTDDQFVIVELRFQANFSWRAIAQTVGGTGDSVRKKFARIRNKLREGLPPRHTPRNVENLVMTLKRVHAVCVSARTRFGARKRQDTGARG